MSQDHNIFSRVKAAISGLKSDLSTVEKSIAAEQAELDRLRKAPVPLEDIRQVLATVVASRAAKGRTLLAANLLYLQNHPQEIAGDQRNLEPRVSILTACRPDQAATPQSVEVAVCALLEHEILAGVQRFLDQVDWPESGPPIADRPKLIAEAERRLSKATEAREELRRSAASAGVLL
ncbi:MAG: hypothetical protein AW09_000358 [Candidatus Accumulibacter phosphatis]|uniref:Uncharacterized protein n=1 Tax=Candidatus Accumulibacter phosphatis TaxID=327160 RepID=A0A080LZS4_9PROT|nr:MAG: hypothetical protein AW09_000358 [Candidatus Accumulibacter phosphatis]